MHIHSKAFAPLREQIAAQLPDHAIAFDVVFESAGKRVDWHGDYESLGPFAFDGVASIQNHDFVSVHFNLTADGGHKKSITLVFSLPLQAYSGQYCDTLELTSSLP